MMEIEGYEYKIQILNRDDEWVNTWTNKFDSDIWYPDLKGVKNAFAQIRATRWGRENTNVYRLVRRPYGAVEVV